MRRSGQPHERNRRLRLLRGTGICLAFLLPGLLSAAVATAGEVHVLTKSFGAGELSLTEHSGLAVDQQTEEVYVADTGNGRIAKFTRGGAADGTLATLASPTFVAVDNAPANASERDIYAVDSGNQSITKFTPAGSVSTSWGSGGHKEGLGEIAGIAVDTTGNLWVYNTESVMREFSQAGAQLREWTAGIGVAAAGITLDSNENLYMVRGSHHITKYDSEGAQVIYELGNEVSALASDYQGNEVYGIELSGSAIERLDTAGNTLERFGGGTEVQGNAGLAELEASDAVFATVASAGKVLLFELENVEPPSVSIEPVDSVTSTSAHVSGHIDPNAPAGNPSSYDVRWHFECTPGCSVAPSGEIPADATSHLVEGTVEGLEPGAEYTVTLVAENAGNTVTATGPSFHALPIAPTFVEEFASGISSTEATLAARGVRPHGAETTYHFEYVPRAAYETTGFSGPQARSSAAGTLPGDTLEHEISVPVTELSAGTPYVFRLIATNSAGTLKTPPATFTTQAPSLLLSGGCTNEVFRTGPSAALPDCRAFELASPVDKAGVDIEGLAGSVFAAEDGSAVAFYNASGSGIPAEGAGARQAFGPMLSSRTSEGWSTRRLSPPESEARFYGFLGASPNARFSLLSTADETPESGLVLIDGATGSLTQVAARAHTPQGLSTFASDAIADDGSWAVFESSAALAPAAEEGVDNVYRWERATGQVSLVGVLPAAEGGAGPEHGSFGGAYEWQHGETEKGGAIANLYAGAIHAVSEDGSRVYFTAGRTGQLYLRSGLLGASPSTLRVSAPNPGVVDHYVEESGEELPAAFLEGTPDGSRAFFISGQHLTADATTGEEDTGHDLYRFDAGTGRLVDITPDPTEEGEGGARVLGLLGAATDGSSGYFAAEGDLATGATPGRGNVYRFEESSPGAFKLTFIATLTNPSAEPGQASAPYNWVSSSGAGETNKSARVSSDGNVLIFSSSEPLTGYQSLGCGPPGKANYRCSEIFMYRVGSSNLLCLSCDPSGARAAGGAELTPSILLSDFNPQISPAPLLTRNLSGNGDRAFFQTPDSLVAGDSNGGPACRYRLNRQGYELGNPTCMDVYEWEAAGTPKSSCTKVEVNGGCLYLLSGGQINEASDFIDASTDGTSVFIATRAQLVPVDRDELFDVYDVRALGGLVSQHPEPPAEPCSGEGCRGPAGVPLSPSAVATPSFRGSGNIRHKRCARHPKTCRKPKRRRKAKQRHRSKGGHHKAGSAKGGRK